MPDIDKWFADICGIHIFSNNHRLPIELWTTPDGWVCLWLISDPRCREIIRERFNLSTLNRNAKEGKWGCGDEKSKLVGHGKTIKEAEVTCLKAIYDARDM